MTSTAIPSLSGCTQCFDMPGETHFFGVAACDWGSLDCFYCEDDVAEPNCHGTSVGGTCAASHPWCGNSRANVQKLVAALEAVDVKAVRRLLGSDAAHFKWNASRGVVQVLNCVGAVVGQYLVPGDVSAAL